MPRRLGQHFLKDRRALRKIAAALEITSRDTIVEIGPGHGELTKFLLEASPKKIIVIEKDKELAILLHQKFPDIKVIEGDILKILPTLHSKLETRNSKLIGNIPYYLTGYLFRKIGELEKKPKLIVFTIQKEVAERICASPRSSASGLRRSAVGMNLLSASVQFWGKPKIVGRISKKAFRPPPKVDSAVIKIVPRKRQPNRRDAENYYKFIRILFRQPRKTVFNNLRAGLKLSQEEVEKGLKILRISPKLRPADLRMSDINKLAVIFSNKRV